MAKKIIILHNDKLVKIPPVISDIYILHQLGYEIVLIDNGINESLAKTFCSFGIKVYEIEAKGGNKIQKAFDFYRYRRKTLKILKREVDDFNNTVLWIESGRTLLALGKTITKYKYVLQISELSNEHPYLIWAISRVIDKAKVVFMPEYCRSMIYKVWFHLDKAPIVLPNKPYFIPNDSELDSLKSKYGKYDHLFEGKKLILYQGLITKDRNLTTFIQAVKSLGDNYIFLLIGSDDNFVNELKKIDNSLVYLGFIPAPDYFYFTRKAFIGVLSYDSNSLNNVFCAPNKIWEYARFGLPMIGNDIPGLRYTIYSHGAGLCADLDSIESVKNAIIRIEENYQNFRKNSLDFYNSCDNLRIIREAIKDL